MWMNVHKIFYRVGFEIQEQLIRFLGDLHSYLGPRILLTLYNAIDFSDKLY